jgi:hypothetical protein
MRFVSLFIIALFLPSHRFGSTDTALQNGLQFRFKRTVFTLEYPMGSPKKGFVPKGVLKTAQLDTMSNWYNNDGNYMEIIRQDDPVRPGIGVALGFEFDEDNGEYPYTPAYAVLQLKDFGWGGVEFGPRDTSNYTGISNNVSDDLQIEIDNFRNDTIFGRFSGVLVSGAGPMTPIEHGHFAVKVYRIKK